MYFTGYLVGQRRPGLEGEVYVLPSQLLTQAMKQFFTEVRPLLDLWRSVSVIQRSRTVFNSDCIFSKEGIGP